MKPLAINSAFVLTTGDITAVALGNNKFRKAILRIGDFKIDQGERDLPVDADALKLLADNGNRYIAAGHRIGIPNGHDKHGDADANRGWITAFKVDGDRLMADMDLIGDDAIAAAQRSDVSIYAVPNFKDDKGETYEWLIRHVSLTTDPQISGLGDFIAIAASNDVKPEQVPVYKPAKGEHMNFAKIALALGIAVTMTAENAEALILSAVEKLSKAGDPKPLELANKMIADLKKQITAGPKAITLSSTEAWGMRKARDARLEQLVMAAKITPSVADKLREALDTDLMLSIPGGGSSPAFDVVLDAVELNDPIKLHEQTKSQNIQLAQRTAPDKAEPAYVESVKNDMVAMAGGAPTKKKN